jgi:hypothetical protein
VDDVIQLGLGRSSLEILHMQIYVHAFIDAVVAGCTRCTKFLPQATAFACSTAERTTVTVVQVGDLRGCWKNPARNSVCKRVGKSVRVGVSKVVRV